MKLYETNFKAIVDKEELPETEIKMLYKKSGKNHLRQHRTKPPIKSRKSS